MNKDKLLDKLQDICNERLVAPKNEHIQVEQIIQKLREDEAKQVDELDG